MVIVRELIRHIAIPISKRSPFSPQCGKLFHILEIKKLKREETLAKAAKKEPGLWLFKEEPTHYSYEDLVKDKKTIWDGVSNNAALKNLRSVRKGDRVLYYHTGKEKAIVGEMKVVSDPFPDPAQEDEKLVVVEVKPAKKWAQPVTLAQIKAEPDLADWDLVRISRLSIVPVSSVQWEKVEKLSQ